MVRDHDRPVTPPPGLHEARLADAQKTYNDVTIKVRNMQASISARLIDIREITLKFIQDNALLVSDAPATNVLLTAIHTKWKCP